MVVQKVAVIGAGVAGLTSIKSCLEAGLTPTCFEQRSWLGGLWNYSDEVRPNIASVHYSTMSNSSKIMTSLSDFPIPKEFPNYMSHRLLQKYLEMYTAQFGLEKYIQFDTVIERLSRSDDHAETGRWVVSSRQLKEESSAVHEETFDAVMVCNGHHWDKAMPTIPGLEKFQGVQIHSGEYRTFQQFVGKRVVVVGCGNSGGDIASELSHHAAQVYLSTRSGAYIIERIAPPAIPMDIQLTRFGRHLPARLQAAMFSGLVNARYDMKSLGLQPIGDLWQTQYAVVNDTLPCRIISGSIIVKDDVTEVAETAVKFNGGDVVDDIDALVFCTGFKLSFPFAEDIICTREKHYASLYKHVFLPEADHNTLAVIGGVDVEGAKFPIIEMQARVAAEVFAGRCLLPNKDRMVAEVEQTQKKLREIGFHANKFIHVPYVAYLDELADMIGAKPTFWSQFITSPRLALQCFFGPCVAAQYRLQGPNPKDTRNIIDSIEEYYLYPLGTRKCPTAKPKNSRNMYFTVFAFVACVSSVAFWKMGLIQLIKEYVPERW